MSQAEIELHEYQDRAFTSTKPIVVACAGIQGGKTRVGSLKLMDIWSLRQQAGDNYIIASPDYKIQSQSTKPAFMALFDGYGKYNGMEDKFVTIDGSTFWFRSMRDPWSCEGMTDVYGIWLDEGGKISGLGFDNLMGRAAFRQAQIIVTTTPYALNFLYSQIYKPWMQGKRPDVDFIQWTSIDNPYFPQEEFDRQKKLLDPRLFSMKYEGTFTRMSGLVFDFSDKNYTDPFPIDRDKFDVYAGVDFGYTNPFAITVRAINKKSLADFQIAEHYQSFMSIGEIIQTCKNFKAKYNIKTFICDSEDPGKIHDLGVAGISAIAIKKYPHCLKDFIAWHNELIRTGTHKIFNTLKYTPDEYETYHYPEQLESKEENLKENPVDSHNHLMGANMYVTAYTRNLQREAIKPKIYPNTRLQNLLQGKLPSQRKVKEKAEGW